MVSEAKCSIFFSPNVVVETKAQVCTELNIMTEAISDKYLGLEMVGLDRSESFVYLLERMIQRIKGWKEKTSVHGSKRDTTQVCHTIHASFRNVSVQNPKEALQGDV